LSVIGSRSVVPSVLLPLIAVVAIAGYLLGSHRGSATTSASSTAPAAQTQIASEASVRLEYPRSWSPARAVAAIPGFPIAHPLLLAPEGRADRAGLLSGQLPAGAASPLPASFLALLRGIPRTEVLNLASLQAYRYSGLSGYDRTLEVYVVALADAAPTTLVCYAAKGFSAYLEQCARIVATVALIDGQTTEELTPDAAYAAQLSALTTALDGQRVKLREAMHRRAGEVPQLAATLARRFAGASAAVARLEAPQPASAAQAGLVISLRRARGAYAALAAADGEPLRSARARRRVGVAETGVDRALESFALLGYNHT
jgi:hypothetical protein